MAITILPPVVEDFGPYQGDADESMSVDSVQDVEMSGVSRPHKRPRLGSDKIATGIVTPGEVVTDDPQWMRWVPRSSRPAFCTWGTDVLVHLDGDRN